MNPVELQKRQANAEGLRVFQVNDSLFYVESSEGKICYRVEWEDGTPYCTCRDFSRNINRDPAFKCKHIIAALEGNGNVVTNGERLKPKLDDRFIANIQGKDFVLYAGLLDLAHQKGLIKLSVEPLQYPAAENGNMAICKAIAQSKHGEVFIDVGDANPTNTNKKIAAHILRMASTRAKARALRDLTNIGITCLEELGDLGEAIETLPIAPLVNKKAQPSGNAKPPTTTTKTQTANQDPQPVTPTTPGETVSPPAEAKTTSHMKLFVAQRKAIENLAQRRGYSLEDLDVMVQEHYSVPLDELSSEDAGSFIRYLQKSA